MAVLERHKVDAKRPQLAHKAGIASAWAEGSVEMQATLDFAASFELGHSPREESGEYFKYSHCTAIGIIVYFPGLAEKLCFIGLSMNQAKTAEVAVFCLNKVLLLCHEMYPELFNKIKRFRLFADCGKHFRAHVFSHYVLVELFQKFKNFTESELSFFLEDHGKGEHDGWFGVLQGIALRGAQQGRVKCLGDLLTVLKNGHEESQQHHSRLAQPGDRSKLVGFDYGEITGAGLSWKRLEVPNITMTYALTSQHNASGLVIRDRTFPDVQFGLGKVVPMAKVKESKKKDLELEPRWARTVEDVPRTRYDSLRDKQERQDRALIDSGGQRSVTNSVFPDEHFNELLNLAHISLPSDLKIRKARADALAREPGRLVGYWSDGANAFRFAVCRGEVEIGGKEIWLEYEDASGLGVVATDIALVVARASRKVRGLRFLDSVDGVRFAFEGGEDTWVQCSSCKAWRKYAEEVNAGALWVCPTGCNVFTLTSDELPFHPSGLPKRVRCSK